MLSDIGPAKTLSLPYKAPAPGHPPPPLPLHPLAAQVGKLHFGYILGWTVVGSGLIWFVLNSMTGSDPEAADLGLYACCCLLGYALLPLVGHALLSLLLPRHAWAGFWGGPRSLRSGTRMLRLLMGYLPPHQARAQTPPPGPAGGRWRR